MKITKKELRTMILQEMCDMHRQHADQGHEELMSAVISSADGCPIKARGLLQRMLQSIEPEAHKKEVDMQQDIPNPATSGRIPQGEELMGDDAYMEQKKPTAIRGLGGSLGILGPGFR
jgi:hypothetical protein